MVNRLVQLKDGILIEVEEAEGRQRPIAASDGIDKVGKSLDQVKIVLERIATAMKECWDSTAAKLEISQLEIELGLSFEAEGNLFVTKAKGGANLVVKLTAKGLTTQSSAV
jgi:NTP-dependent ternary system trypsin peptidase co-occuring protein